MLRYLLILSFLATVLAGNGYLPTGRAAASTAHARPSQRLPQPAQHATHYDREFFYFTAAEDQRPQNAQKNVRGRESGSQNFARNAARTQLRAKLQSLYKDRNVAGNAHKTQSAQQSARPYSKPEASSVTQQALREAIRAQPTSIRSYAASPGKSAQKNASDGYSGASTNYPNAIADGDKVPNNTPVDKAYARNFLPEGIDVQPGTSYIPLVVRR